MTEDPKKFYSIPQAAEMCGVSRTAMWKWVKSGEVQALVTPGGHHRILREEIDKLMESALPNHQSASGRKTILIVDDEPALLKVLERRFEMAGYRAETATSGFEAGVKLSQAVPDLVLLDLYMPGMDGFEVCRMIKQDPQLRTTKVLVMTGYPTAENQARVMELGADGCLPKSTTPAQVVHHVNALLNA